MSELPPFVTEKNLNDAKEVVKRILEEKGYEDLNEERIEKEARSLLGIM